MAGSEDSPEDIAWYDVFSAFWLGVGVAESVYKVQGSHDEVLALLQAIADGHAIIRDSAAEDRSRIDQLLAAIDRGETADPQGRFAANLRVNREGAEANAAYDIQWNQKLASRIITQRA